MSFLLDALIVATSCLHVFLTPYNKVEESFNLHATHDVVLYGSNLLNYDHLINPGPIPRTFIGPFILGFLTRLVALFFPTQAKFDLQILSRLILSSINALGLILIRRTVSGRYGRLTSLFYALFTVSQFHVPFWMGRTLPNMFAFFPVNLATYLSIDSKSNSKNAYRAIALLTSTAIIFRSELILLLAPLALQSLVLRQTTFSGLIKVDFITALCSIAVTTLVDTYFWRSSTPIWPELAGVYFNVVQGKSADWGTSPYHTYFLTHLPKLLLTSLPLSCLAFMVDGRIRSLLLPNISYVSLISFLGHKEWRFIVYVVPAFNVAAARGARWMVSKPKSPWLGQLAFAPLAFSAIPANLVLTTFFTSTSIVNYPGGEALARFNTYVRDEFKVKGSHVPVHVHISNLAAQTEASLFLHELSPPYPRISSSSFSSLNTTTPPLDLRVTYNKTESLSLSSLSSSAFTHLISENPPSAYEGWVSKSPWVQVDSVDAFPRWVVDWDLLRGKWDGEVFGRMKNIVRMEKEVKLWILERGDLG